MRHPSSVIGPVVCAALLPLLLPTAVLGLHCDVVSHLHTHKFFVSDRRDLLDGRTDVLRLVTVGLSEADIRNTLRCPCTRTPFDPEGRQPYPPAVLRATWRCPPDIFLAEMSASERLTEPLRKGGAAMSWGSAQWEEFRARSLGKAQWGIPLERAALSFIWHFASWSFEMEDALVFALLVEGTVPQARLRRELGLGLGEGGTAPRLLSWTSNRTEVHQAVRRALQKSALDALEKRAYERGHAEGRAVGQRAAAAAADAANAAVGLAQLWDEYREEQGRAVVPLPRAAAPASTDLEDLLDCPIEQARLRDPHLNRVSGRTYSGPAIKEWVRRAGTDPITRQPTAASDLVKNRLVADLLERIGDN